jgi:hypothetical protein
VASDWHRSCHWIRLGHNGQLSLSVIRHEYLVNVLTGFPPAQFCGVSDAGGRTFSKEGLPGPPYIAPGIRGEYKVAEGVVSGM